MHLAGARPQRPVVRLFKTGPGRRRALVRRGDSLRDGAKVWTWNGTTPSGRPVVAGDLPGLDRDARPGRQPRPLAAAGPRAACPRRATAPSSRATAASRSATSASRPPDVGHARGRPGRVLRRRARASRGRGRCAASARARRRRSRRKTSARVRLHAPGRESGVYLHAGAHARTHTHPVPFAVQSAKRHRVLVVLPVMTWQGRNSRRRRRRRPAEPARSRRRGQAVPRLRGRRPARGLRRPATRRCWPGWTAAATATTSRPTSRSPPAAARGWRTTAASSSPPTRAGCRAALQQRLRRYVRGGGRVASFGVDSLRRQVSLTPRGRMVDPTPPATTDVFGVAAAPALRLRKPTNLVEANDDIDFFGGDAGRLRRPSRSSRRPSSPRRGRAPARSPRTRRPGARSSPPSARARGSSCASALPELPSHLGARANDPNTVALLDRTWTLLSR